MPRYQPLVALLAIAFCTTAFAADLPLRDVVLFSSGVGYFNREGAVDGDAEVELSFRTAQINDLLKSLVLKSGPKATPGARGIDPYEVLLLPEEADRDRVMRAYFKQRALYAADRVANMSEEFQNTAEQKLAQIEQAYQMLMNLDRARRQEDDHNGNGK